MVSRKNKLSIRARHKILYTQNLKMQLEQGTNASRAKNEYDVRAISHCGKQLEKMYTYITPLSSKERGSSNCRFSVMLIYVKSL